MNSLNKIFAIVSETFEMVVDLILSNPKKNKSYSGGFGSATSLLSAFNKGFNLTGNKKISKKLSFQNCMILGNTGSGKSSVTLIPTLFSTIGSFITNDPSGELYTKTSGFLKSKGVNVRRLNFSNHTLSSGYNPLERTRTSSEIQKIASLLVENSLGGKGKDPFWNTQAVSLIAMLISILKTQDKHYQNLYNVRQLLNALGGNPKSVDNLFSQFADDVLFNEYKSFLAYDDKLSTSIIATCKAALQIFSDPEVARVTSHDTINFAEFREHPTALFIQNSVADQRYFGVITSIFFEQFFAYLMSRFPGKEEQHIFLLIDEASSLHLPTLPIAVSNVRKHSAGIMILYQSYQQCINQYGKENAEAIRSNCFSKVYFTGQDMNTCRELSDILGKYEYEDKDKKKRIREVMTPDEVRTMPANRSIIVCGHHKAINARMVPYYKRYRYKKHASLPVPETEEQITPPLEVLPLKKKNDVKAQ